MLDLILNSGIIADGSITGATIIFIYMLWTIKKETTETLLGIKKELGILNETVQDLDKSITGLNKEFEWHKKEVEEIKENHKADMQRIHERIDALSQK